MTTTDERVEMIARVIARSLADVLGPEDLIWSKRDAASGIALNAARQIVSLLPTDDDLRRERDEARALLDEYELAEAETDLAFKDLDLCIEAAEARALAAERALEQLEDAARLNEGGEP